MTGLALLVLHFSFTSFLYMTYSIFHVRSQKAKAHEVIGESSLGEPRQATPHHGSRSDRSELHANLERMTVVGYATQHDVSPSPSEYGSFRTPETSVNYVRSSHWAAVLDSIADLRNHIVQDEEVHPRVLDSVRPPASSLKPQLLYTCAMH